MSRQFAVEQTTAILRQWLRRSPDVQQRRRLARELRKAEKILSGLQKQMDKANGTTPTADGTTNAG